ncbi:hypothetical protein MFIFM68171_06598 [Madurella fahalii]|uniref:BTB domain-containing protein n=1 Tax=Madurella fahalii TaxID=1157608 RepID=A0ABQ0GF78_9PEZI
MNITAPVPGEPPRYSDLMTIHPAEQITLDVSGQRFITAIPTLAEKSQYFRDFFRGDWRAALRDDGTVFVDSDPEVFQHIVKYLRRGIFPLSYDQKKGHNYKLYADILAEARHFRIPKLERWLTDQLYLNCITSSTVWSSSFKDDKIQGGYQTTSTWRSDIVSTQLVRNDINVVRRLICGHEAEGRNPCSKRSCVVGCSGLKDDVETYRWAEVGKSLTFHHGWCSDTGKEFVEYWERISRPAPPSKS